MNKKHFSLLIGFALPLAVLLIFLSWMPKGPTASWQPVVQAQANIITVTTALDNTAGDPVDPNDCTGSFAGCTLREAIERANDLGGDALITFDGAYTITLIYRAPPGNGEVLPFEALFQDDVSIDGDLDNDDSPDIVINGENVTETTAMGLRFTGSGGTIEGLVIQNFEDYGISISDGDNLTITHNYIGTNRTGRQSAPNRLGIYVLREAVGNQISANIIAGNSQNGIQISARPGYEATQIPHNNTIANNWIGTNPWGDDLGNASKGVVIRDNARDNLVFNNRIYYNGYYGVHLSGRKDNGTPDDTSDDEFYPPRGNQIISNTIVSNARSCPPFGSMSARAGVLNEDTHLAVSNTIPSLVSADYDNLVASNVINDNGNDACSEPVGFGIYNLGASPLISDNVVQGSKQHGIYNQTDFNLTYSPLDADDDILSIPIIQGNTIQNNDDEGIRSLDTSPVAPYQLHISNTVQNNDQGDRGVDVSQVWYGLVEVLYGDLTTTLPITRNAAPIIDMSYPGYSYEIELFHAITVSLFAGTAEYTSTVWADNNSDDYFDVTTWAVVPQFVVTGGVNLRDYSPQDIVVELASAPGVNTYQQRGVAATLANGPTLTDTFSYDGLAATHPVSDFLVPAYVETGPYGRYQVAQVYALIGGDSDGDGVDDSDECPEGPPCNDEDDDGIPDYLDPDDDGDGIPSEDECSDPLDCEDTDDDGIPDYLDPDDDGDGIPSEDECSDPLDCEDNDDDGIPDYLDPDDDNDGIPSADECSDPQDCEDSDGDGIPDYKDPDDDDDGVPSADECSDPQDCEDTDDDGIPDYLDPDDDDDGIDTGDEAQECTPEPGNEDNDQCFCEGDDCYVDTDNDGLPDYLDPDDDNDGIDTGDEAQTCTPEVGNEDNDQCFCDGDDCYVDTDNDDLPDYLDPDDDNDGVGTGDEAQVCTPEVGNEDNDQCFCEGDDCYVDTDNDDLPDYLDPDDDGDGVDTADEAQECTPEVGNEDNDECFCEGDNCYVDTGNDGIPDYKDSDDDDDGIPTADEYNDPDDPSDDFCADTTQDSDGDGTPDCQDNDADGDGIPNYQDPDSDGDGTPDWEEAGCTSPPSGGDTCPNPDQDSDDDGIPDWLDPNYALYLPLVLRTS